MFNCDIWNFALLLILATVLQALFLSLLLFLALVLFLFGMLV